MAHPSIYKLFACAVMIGQAVAEELSPENGECVLLVVTSEEIKKLAPMADVISNLEKHIDDDCIAPKRQVIETIADGVENLFLIMPAFGHDGRGAVKLSSVFPANTTKNLPTIQSSILVFSENGAPLALLDGAIITNLRTAAASAVASKYLSLSDSRHLVVFGTGALAPYMALAHSLVRPIETITVCGRSVEKMEDAIDRIRALVNPEIEINYSLSPDDAVKNADIVSCATSSAVPLFQGDLLRQGAHIDLVGSFSPAKRETDDAAVLRSRIFVDTFEGAMEEAGDILDPLRRGVITKDRIEGDLASLAAGRVRGRMADDEVTLFKSVGAAIEDYATAMLVLDALKAR